MIEKKKRFPIFFFVCFVLACVVCELPRTGVNIPRLLMIVEYLVFEETSVDLKAIPVCVCVSVCVTCTAGALDGTLFPPVFLSFVETDERAMLVLFFFFFFFSLVHISLSLSFFLLSSTFSR